MVACASASLLSFRLSDFAQKRYFASRDEDNSQPAFQRHSWMRNSVALPDDMPSPMVQGPSVNPRPPTMIERKQTLNYSNIGRRGLQDQGAYTQDVTGYGAGGNAGMAYTGYQDSPYGVPPMPSYHPSQPSPNAAQPFFSPIGSPPLRSPGVASFDETLPPMQHASYDAAAGAPVYFSRRESNMSNAQPGSSAALPAMPNPYDNAGADGYATLSRDSVTPYQAQQYAAISKQLHEPALESIGEGAAPSSVHDDSPFADPASASAPEQPYQELTPPSLAQPRVNSTPPMLPPMRTISPVGPVGAQPSISQLASAFPATPTSPTFPPAVAIPSSPRSSSFKQPPPLSPAPGAQGQIISVPESVHVGRETPVQFGFTEPAAPAPAEAKAVSVAPNAKRMSVASRKSVGKSGRPDTMYDEEDAYGGF
ncbi:hypothetical protein JB92DRAFT_38063 [Gautieria morchelliformis]|nr:hypothetical protein JB92DRAFT_38063 [Gautieria morchelliformis]